MNIEHLIKKQEFLSDELLVSANKGAFFLNWDSLPPNINLSDEDFESVAEQLIVDQRLGKDSDEDFFLFSQPPFSSDTPIDSDDPTSDCSALMTDPQLILEQNFIEPLVYDKVGSSKSDSDNSGVLKNGKKDLLDGAKQPTKRRGGWPKGRKRKPELLHLPPKAPATGYNLYLNDMRKQFKGSQLVFHEITKIIGNKWSSLSLEEKEPYLKRAEEDKRRYRDELKVYRESGAYQLYLAKKRKKRVQNNVLSESDMDATDDIDDEDNEELYCRTCDQWFHNLHNKREHLQGRQHIQAVMGDMRSELGSKHFTQFQPLLPAGTVKEVNLEEVSDFSDIKESPSVAESVANLISSVSKREREIKMLKVTKQVSKASNLALQRQLYSLNERQTKLKEEILNLQNMEKSVEADVFQLWRVPSLFITTDFSSSALELSEYLTDE